MALEVWETSGMPRSSRLGSCDAADLPALVEERAKGLSSDQGTPPRRGGPATTAAGNIWSDRGGG